MTSITNSRSYWKAARFLPLLVRPRVVGWLNARSRREAPTRRIALDALMYLFIGILVWSLWLSGIKLGVKTTEEIALKEQWLSLIFSGMIGGYLVLLFASSFIAALSALFLSQDLGLIIAAPLTRGRFFLGKLFDVLVCSSWLPLLIVLPLLGGVSYGIGAPWEGYLMAGAHLVVLTIGVGALAISCAALCGTLLPAARLRELVLGAALITSVALYLALNRWFPSSAAQEDISSVIHGMLRAVSGGASTSWGVGADLLRALFGGGFIPGMGSLTVCLFGIASVLISVGVLRCSYLPGFSRMMGARNSLRIHSRAAEWRIKRVLMFLPMQTRAVAGKELRLFSRDMLQTLQLVILLGVTIVYLYNFQTLQTVGVKFSPSPTAQRWWDALLILLNLFVGGMVICAVCLRFVFPSISMEGRSFWIIQSSPFNIADYLHAKHLSWFAPLSVISSVILATGACAIQAEPRVIVVSTLVSWIMCYGIVWLAVGFGAFFANFSFEHYAQLTGSFGSLIFILASGALVLLDLIPAGFLIALRTLKNEGVPFTPQEWYSCVIASATLLVVLNALIGRWAKQFGAQALVLRE